MKPVKEGEKHFPQKHGKALRYLSLAMRRKDQFVEL